MSLLPLYRLVFFVDCIEGWKADLRPVNNQNECRNISVLVIVISCKCCIWFSKQLLCFFEHLHFKELFLTNTRGTKPHKQKASASGTGKGVYF